MTVIEDLERKLITKLSKRESIIAKGRLECHIAPMIGLHKTSTGYATAYSLLERLEKEQKVSIVWSGSNMREVALATKDPVTASVSKVDQMTEPTEAPAVDEVTPEVTMTKVEEIKLERINLAILALQEVADPNGHIKGATTPIIMRVLNVPKYVAADLNSLLSEMNLRAMSGPRRALVHTVPTDETKISIEQLRAAEATRIARRKKGETQEEATDSQASEPAVPVVAPDQTKPDQPVTDSEKSLLEQLADVIVDLKAQLALRDRVVTERDATIVERDEEIKDLNERLVKGSETAQGVVVRLKDQVTRLETDNRMMSGLLKRVGAPTERIEKLIAEFADKNTKE